MKIAENRKHAAAIAAACIALVALVVLGTVIISYWNTPIAKTESRTMQAMLLQEDGSAEPCTVLISGISYHYLFRNHADSFEANDPGGVFVNGSRIMDSLILSSDIDSDWMFWQDDMLWCDAAGEQLIVLLHRDADGAFAETGTPVLVIAYFAFIIDLHIGSISSGSHLFNFAVIRIKLVRCIAEQHYW